MVHVLILGFAPARILRKGLQSFFNTYERGDFETKIHYLNQHYPLEKRHNELECMKIARNAGLHYYDAGKNLGLHAGLNFLLERIAPADDDIIIAYDPDFKCLVSGWNKALIDVLSHPGVGWATLMHYVAEREMQERGYTEGVIKGHKVWLTHTACTNIVCAWPYHVLKKIGGIHEHRPFYGHLEAPMFQLVNGQGFEWAFVYGFHDTDELRLLHDQEYVDYKHVHAHEQSWDGDFESWLNAGKPRKANV